MNERKPNGIQLLVRAVVRGKDGEVISDSGQKPTKSFVIQFLEFIYALFAITGVDLDSTTIAGSEDWIWRNAYEIYWQLCIKAPANISTYGIVVGTGDTGETNTDYKLETRINHGTGVGQLSYGAMNVSDTPSVVGANVDWEILRSFTNSSGSTITVKEAGIYFNAYNHYHCTIRDVLSTPAEIANGCSLTLYYTFRTTV